MPNPDQSVQVVLPTWEMDEAALSFVILHMPRPDHGIAGGVNGAVALARYLAVLAIHYKLKINAAFSMWGCNIPFRKSGYWLP
jgi:hypothetical protein